MNLDNISNRLGYKRTIFISIILVSLGVVLINTSSVPSIGVVFIALGGFFLIVGMARKKNEGEKQKEEM